QKEAICTLLSFCTDAAVWSFVGEKTIKGKEAVKQYLEETDTETTKFKIERMIEKDDFVTQELEISFENKDGEVESYLVYDIWRFENVKMAELKSFVIKDEKNK